MDEMRWNLITYFERFAIVCTMYRVNIQHGLYLAFLNFDIGTLINIQYSLKAPTSASLLKATTSAFFKKTTCLKAVDQRPSRNIVYSSQYRSKNWRTGLNVRCGWTSVAVSSVQSRCRRVLVSPATEEDAPRRPELDSQPSVNQLHSSTATCKIIHQCSHISVINNSNNT